MSTNSAIRTPRDGDHRPTVAFVAHSLNLETGGGSNYTLHQLACGLVEADCRVKVFTVTPHLNRLLPDAPYQVIEKRLSDSYLSIPKQLVLALRLFSWQKGVDVFQIEAPSFLMAAGLYRMLGGRTPVLVRLHSHSWFCSNVSRMNAECFKSCSVLDRIRHRDESLIRKALLAPGRFAADLLRRAVLGQIDGIESVSEPAAQIEKAQGLRKNDRTIIPPIVGATVCGVPNGTTKGTASGPLHLLYIGRLTREKGVDVLVRAMDGLRAAATLDVVGDGPEMASLHTLARKRGVDGNVTFHGWLSQERLPEFYEAASLFVHPGRWPEPSGRSVVDALASGLPVIVSDVGGPPWIAGDAGLTFRAEDHADLREKIETLAEDPALRERLAASARPRVAGFNAADILARLIGIYGEVSPAFAGPLLAAASAQRQEVRHGVANS